MASSTKPVVHNHITTLPEKGTETRPQSSSTEHLVKLGHVVLEISVRTDRQADTLITIVCSSTGTKQ